MTSSGPSFWFDADPSKDPIQSVTTSAPGPASQHDPPVERARVVIIGAGFTGLWTAMALTNHDPSLDIVIVEADQVAHGASGRNGGFVEASLTHGIANGLRHFPKEYPELHRLGRDNLQGLFDVVADHDIDCALEATGTIDVATQPWQLGDLEESATIARAQGEEVEVLDAAAMQAEVDSPTYLGGLHQPSSGAIVDPVALARGLARVLRSRGVRIDEGRRVLGLRREGQRVRVDTEAGPIRAEQVVLATNAWSHTLVPSTARHYVPVYDHILVTEPLATEQMARIGWKGRQGLSDSANQFHYYRLTDDDRILWGGYDAVYHYGNGVGPDHDHRRATYDLLAQHFRATFPQLRDVAFSHWWGGPIATTTRFTVTFGRALDDRVVYALGYTGLGVGASRFAGRVLSDMLVDPTSPLLDLDFTSSSPFPFPPEPLRWLGVQMTRRALARADRRGGRRGPWLSTLDAFGIGFDS